MIEIGNILEGQISMNASGSGYLVSNNLQKTFTYIPQR